MKPQIPRLRILVEGVALTTEDGGETWQDAGFGKAVNEALRARASLEVTRLAAQQIADPLACCATGRISENEFPTKSGD